MNEFILVAVKLLIGFFVLTIIINVSGKGNLSPSSASDQVQNYVLGGIIGGVIYNNSIQILNYIGILCIWCALVLTLKWIKQYNVKAKQLIDGRALIIIDNGNHIYSARKVKRAVVEQNGELIITHEGEENPKFPLITDGQLQTDILQVIGKDEKWLLKEMKKQGMKAYSDVLGEYVDGKLSLTAY